MTATQSDMQPGSSPGNGTRRAPVGWRRAALFVAGFALAGAVLGIFVKPPGGAPAHSTSEMGVLVTPVYPDQLVAAHVPSSTASTPASASYKPGPAGQTYGGYILAQGPDRATALERAAGSGIEYASTLTQSENAVMRKDGASGRIGTLQRQVIREPTRFSVQYAPVPQSEATAAQPTSFAPAPLRTALIGALVGALLLGVRAFMVPRIRAPGLITGWRAAGIAWRPSPVVIASLAGVALAVLLAVLASASTAAYTVVAIGLMVALGFLFTQAWGQTAIRGVIVAIIVLSPLRGALLGLSNAFSLPNGLTTVNAIQPALVTGCALAVLLARRGRFPRNAKPLLVGWALIAGVAVLDFATQTVGFQVYAIGLAQYLTYPTLAVLAWLAFERGDSERLLRLLVALGVLVAISVFVEAAGLVKWVEAAAPNGDPFVGARYGGATGSYLHASMFLGTVAILAMGLVLEGWRTRMGLVALGGLALIVAAMAMTLSRGGFVIAGIGAIALLVGGGARDRRRLIGAGIAVLAAAAVLGAAGGVTPGEIGHRLQGGFSPKGDPGNASRLDSWRNSVDTFKGLSAPEKALGEGLAATGNARVVALLQPNATESYPLKLLLEVGVLGALLIGGYLIWAVTRFARASIRGPNPLIRSAGAAGLGFTAYCVVYPTLEVQVLAMVWWMLLVVCLAIDRFRARDFEQETTIETDGDLDRTEPARPTVPAGAGGRPT